MTLTEKWVKFAAICFRTQEFADGSNLLILPIHSLDDDEMMMMNLRAYFGMFVFCTMSVKLQDDSLLYERLTAVI